MAVYVSNAHDMVLGYVTFAVHPDHKVSEFAHEHVTLRFGCRVYDNGNIGHVHILTRDASRSTSAQWDAIGTWEYLPTNHVAVTFHERSAATGLAATAMRNLGGIVVFGLEPSDFAQWDGIETVALKATRKRTNPDTLMGRADITKDRIARNTARKRCKIQKRFGAIGTVDVDAMRRAVVAQRVKRATIARSQ